jgi:alpha-L-rhamnosidase
MATSWSPETLAAHAAAQAARRVRLPAGTPVAAFLALAETLKPHLQETVQAPLGLVRAEPDAGHVLRFRMRADGDAADLARRSLRDGDAFIVDFGGHRTGHLSFRITAADGEADSPVRLRLTFGEVPTDVAEPLHPYQGRLSAAWLPEEVLVVDDLPQTVRVPRRHAFRYVKVEVLATSVRFGVCFTQWAAHALTSATATVPPLPARAPDWLRRIDQIAIATLRDCLQTSFEDGPRRDRRLWIGDLRLQALASHATYRADSVVQRCLYLFAGLPRADGLVNACVYERPLPGYADTVCVDYAAIYNITLQEYVQATGDTATGHALWPVALRQIDILCGAVGADDLFVDTGATWCFIDWETMLDRSTAVQGVLILALRRTLALARLLGRAADVAHYPDRIDRMVQAARTRCFDADNGVYISGPQRQVSCASQAWMALAGVPQTPEQGKQAILRTLDSPDALQPTTPYLMHYLAEALVATGARADALALIRRYWGAMADAGADTFWEVFEPGQPLSSPYGDIHINSYCHAWSCTPCHFFRTEGLGLDPA